MGASVGAFFGYRERAPGYFRRPKPGPPSASIPIPRLDPIQLAMMETPTFESVTFGRDYAEDEFPEDFTLWGWQSRHIVLWLMYAPVDVIYTFDGVTGLEMRTVYESYRATEGFLGFMVRNTMPGLRAWYQLIVYR